jgi:beta-lactamase class D
MAITSPQQVFVPRVVALFALLFAGVVAGVDGPPPESAPAPEPPTLRTEEIDLGSFFGETDATFVVLEPRKALRRVYNPQRASQPFIPASTFKIPNSLIALESGVADGPDFAIAWDPSADPAQPWWPQSWRRDQVLRTAFQNSVVWYYQELARRIGKDRMRVYLRQLEYGNRNMGGGLDRFWLRGDLRISADEQVEFLRRFYSGELGISRRATEIVREIMVLRETASCRLSGKTGTAEVTPTRDLAWLVGFVECGNDVAFFALNMEGENVWEDWPPQQRTDLVLRLFEQLEIVAPQTT